MSLPRHILVFRFSAMGDVAMTVPILNALGQSYPNLRITIVTREFFKPFFRDLPNVTVYAADLKGKHKGLWGLYKLAKDLKHLNAEAVADLHTVLRTKILKLFLGVSPFVQLDKGRKEKKALVSGTTFKQLKTTHQRYADVFGALGLPIQLTHPTFPQQLPLPEHLTQFFTSNTQSTIGIAPFAAHKGKMYPLSQMRAVIEELSKTCNIILFGGGAKEIALLNTIANTYSNVTNVAGKLSLNDELDIISHLDLMLSMDSGNAHIAAFLGIKVVTIWGVTHPYAGFTPFNQPKDYALVANRTVYPLIPTSIYGNKHPKGYEHAAGSISSETVVATVKEALSN